MSVITCCGDRDRSSLAVVIAIACQTQFVEWRWLSMNILVAASNGEFEAGIASSHLDGGTRECAIVALTIPHRTIENENLIEHRVEQRASNKR